MNFWITLKCLLLICFFKEKFSKIVPGILKPWVREWEEKDMLSKENTLLQKDVDALKAKVSESTQKTSFDVSKL